MLSLCLCQRQLIECEGGEAVTQGHWGTVWAVPSCRQFEATQSFSSVKSGMAAVTPISLPL